MGMPSVREQGPGTDVCNTQDMRVYRVAVLEPGKNTGDTGQGYTLIAILGTVCPDPQNLPVLL